MTRAIIRAALASLLFAGLAAAQSLRPDLAPQWKDAQGQLRWPPDDGCADKPRTETLNPGLSLDRYGSDGGSYFALPGTPFPQRALPYDVRGMAYHIYVVVKPLTASECRIAAWFGEPGGGEQFKTGQSVKQLLESGMLAIAPGS
jgi:hypothetical protein